MNLTPLDIRKQEFGRQMRGYDVEEVNSFLQLVADQFETLLSDRDKYAKQKDLQESKLKEYQEMESTLQDAMMNAQKAGRSAEEESSRRSEVLVQNAELEAERLLQDARRKRQKLLDDIHRLEGQRRSFLLKMKQILKGQVELLDILEEEVLEDKAEIEQEKRSGSEDA
jgi:cell division initiation protein